MQKLINDKVKVKKLRRHGLKYREISEILNIGMSKIANILTPAKKEFYSKKTNTFEHKGYIINMQQSGHWQIQGHDVFSLSSKKAAENVIDTYIRRTEIEKKTTVNVDTLTGIKVMQRPPAVYGNIQFNEL
jgi:hypothetical protein